MAGAARARYADHEVAVISADSDLSDQSVDPRCCVRGRVRVETLEEDLCRGAGPGGQGLVSPEEENLLGHVGRSGTKVVAQVVLPNEVGEATWLVERELVSDDDGRAADACVCAAADGMEQCCFGVKPVGGGVLESAE
jgi:hypothetical protein